MLLCPGAIKNTTQIAYWNVSSLFSPHDKIFLSSAPFCCIGTTVMGQHTFVYLYPWLLTVTPFFQVRQIGTHLTSCYMKSCHIVCNWMAFWAPKSNTIAINSSSISCLESGHLSPNSSHTLEKMLQKLHHKISFVPSTW